MLKIEDLEIMTSDGMHPGTHRIVKGVDGFYILCHQADEAKLREAIGIAAEAQARVHGSAPPAIEGESDMERDRR